MGRRRFLIALAVLGLAFAQMARAATIHVPSGQPNIEAGINSASAGDTVVVACGTYYENIHVSGPASNIVVRSETGEPDCLIVDGQYSGETMHLNGTDGFVLDGLSFIHGSDSAVFFGGATNLWVMDCAFRDSDNPIGRGGGVALANILTATLFERCTFTDNNAGDTGGGVAAGNAQVVFREYLFVSNSAPRGSGAAFHGHTGTLEQCTLFGNTAPVGAGIHKDDAQVDLVNTIIAFNIGPSVSCDIQPITAECTDIFGNTGGDYVNCLAGLLGIDGNVSEDPLFCDAVAHDFRLDWLSPCAPGNSGSCGLIGALDVGCGAVVVEPATWGAIKGMYQ